MHCFFSAPVRRSHFFAATLKSFQSFAEASAAFAMGALSPNAIPAATMAVKSFVITSTPQ
jgi:hypothetical protein